MNSSAGKLVLVPNTLDLGHVGLDITHTVSHGVIQRAASIAHWVVEDAKSARVFLKRVGAINALVQPLQALDIRELPRARKGSPSGAVPQAEFDRLLQPIVAGHDIGLLSEAGLAAVADPGAALVAAAHRAGCAVEVLPGASSITLAVAASGLNGQRFAFEGYLPQDETARAKRIKELESASRRESQTQVVIETPYRNGALWRALVMHLQPGTRLSAACGLTLPGGWCRTARVDQWRRSPIELPADTPTVFLWLA